MNKMIKKTFRMALLLGVLLGFALPMHADNVVAVTLTVDEGQERTPGMKSAEVNLAQILTEINRAHQRGSGLNLDNINMEENAKVKLKNFWSNMHFSCEDNENIEKVSIGEIDLAKRNCSR